MFTLCLNGSDDRKFSNIQSCPFHLGEIVHFNNLSILFRGPDSYLEETSSYCKTIILFIPYLLLLFTLWWDYEHSDIGNQSSIFCNSSDYNYPWHHGYVQQMLNIWNKIESYMLNIPNSSKISCMILFSVLSYHLGPFS